MGGRRLPVVVGAGLVAVLAAVGIAVAVSGDGDGDGDDAATIRLEPIGSSFEGDFLGDLDLRAAGAGVALALPGVPPLGSGVGGALVGIGVDGDVPGLYGGSRDLATCDVEQLVDFLTDPANRAEAEAWAGVHGIDVDDIAEFVDGLTPMRLRFDTRVTNHGFRDGRATPVQSVLQAGTAVLVDDRGVPRAKCACGNPLLEPAVLDEADAAEAAGDEWDGFDPEEVAAVEPAAAPVDAFTLVDVDDGTLFQRPAGTDGEADVVLEPNPELCATFAESPTCAGLVVTEVVPNLAGSTPEAARQALAALGFTGEITERAEPVEGVRPGVVLRSEPEAGAEIPLDAPIVLVVAGDEAPPPSSTSTTRPRTTTTAAPTTSSSTTTTTRPPPSTTTSTTTTTTSSTTTTTEPVILQ